MRRLRVSLYSQVLAWAALNLLLVGACLYAYAPHGQAGLNLFLTQSVRERLLAMARELADDLYQIEPTQWAAVLERQRAISGVAFSARDIARPPHERGEDHGQNPPPPPPGGADPERRPGGPQMPGFAGSDAPPGPPPPGNSPPINVRASAVGGGYDVTIPVAGAWHGGPHDFLITAHAVSFMALLGLFGIGREVLFGLILLSMSALLWWPFVWRITRTVSNLSRATRLMSSGRLDTRVTEARRDELGDLAAAINAMAARLETTVSGQRQFIADVAHEIISPVARMQIGVGILEARLVAADANALADVREDLEQMAVMLNELLLFSRSGVEAERAAPVPVGLRPLVEKIVSSESGDAPIIIEIPERLSVLVHPAMLSRALANLIRNARRYGASSTEPVQIMAAVEGDEVRISVRDRGPGVPQASLARLGEPFFRPELARTRGTGGFGLGLAIVRRCIAVCDGEVSFQNRPGGGFEADVLIPAAPAS